jgi:hypothetical protein
VFIGALSTINYPLSTSLWHVPHLQLASAEMLERASLRSLRSASDN